MSSIDQNVCLELVTGDDLQSRLETLNEMENELRECQEELDQIEMEQREVRVSKERKEMMKLKPPTAIADEVNQESHERPIELNEMAEETENGELENETRHTTNLQARVLEHLALVRKLKQNNSILGLLLDLNREKILDTLGIESWQLLEEKAIQCEMAVHDYILASLNDSKHSKK